MLAKLEAGDGRSKIKAAENHGRQYQRHESMIQGNLSTGKRNLAPLRGEIL
jgi:hypothetical protein